jgi:hypothetical protein
MSSPGHKDGTEGFIRYGGVITPRSPLLERLQSSRITLMRRNCGA